MPEDVDYQWLFATEYPHVVRTVWLIVRDQGRAEEVTQEAFLQLFVHWSKVSRYDSPGTWVRRIAIRRAVRLVQRERTLAALILAIGRQSREPSNVELGGGDIDLDVARAVRALPPRQRAVIALFYFEDRPMDQIAAILGCSVSTCWVHLHKARKRLAAALGEEISSDVS